ncbi:hypothetical protein PIB30_021734 [Stylosanthes scabra]|uniref:Uncharacterized protein n=1 Tax=Stylosanthes scabra TaxID=79078 RepID=A0ABU6T8N6_9FABA|nr:hypothetical protein [Stylosanthes scabra]
MEERKKKVAPAASTIAATAVAGEKRKTERNQERESELKRERIKGREMKRRERRLHRRCHSSVELPSPSPLMKKPSRLPLFWAGAELEASLFVFLMKKVFLWLCIQTLKPLIETPIFGCKNLESNHLHLSALSLVSISFGTTKRVGRWSTRSGFSQSRNE